MVNKKLNQSKVVLKLLVVLKVVLVEAMVEADLLKDVVCKAVIEVALWKDVVNKLLLKGLLPQALRLEVLSQAMIAKLKLLKVKAAQAG